MESKNLRKKKKKKKKKKKCEKLITHSTKRVRKCEEIRCEWQNRLPLEFIMAKT